MGLAPTTSASGTPQYWAEQCAAQRSTTTGHTVISYVVSWGGLVVPSGPRSHHHKGGATNGPLGAVVFAEPTSDTSACGVVLTRCRNGYQSMLLEQTVCLSLFGYWPPLLSGPLAAERGGHWVFGGPLAAMPVPTVRQPGGDVVASAFSTGQIMATARPPTFCYSAPHASELRRQGRLQTAPVRFGVLSPGGLHTPSTTEGVLVSVTLNPSSTRRRAVGTSCPAGACLPCVVFPTPFLCPRPFLVPGAL